MSWLTPSYKTMSVNSIISSLDIDWFFLEYFFIISLLKIKQFSFFETSDKENIILYLYCLTLPIYFNKIADMMMSLSFKVLLF